MFRIPAILSSLCLATVLGGCLSDSPGEPGPDLGGQDTTGFVDTSGTEDTVTRCSAAECGPFEFRKAFWPMAVGNRWTYVDSSYNAQGALTSVDTFTLSVTEVHFDTARQQYWWSLSGGSPIPFPETGPSGPAYLMQRGDTIFTLESGGWDPIVTTQAKFGTIPSSQETVTYRWTYGGDVSASTVGVRNGLGYPTPAGSFTGSLTFEFSLQQDKAFEFKPGVGILGYGYQTRWIPKVEHRGRLLAYSLKP